MTYIFMVQLFCIEDYLKYEHDCFVMTQFDPMIDLKLTVGHIPIFRGSVVCHIL